MEDFKTNQTLVNVVLDRSGSMKSNKAGTIDGYNEYINALKADKETEYTVTMIQFDSVHIGPELTIKYQEKPLADVPELTDADYEPRGTTPLYDAIGECIRRVETKGRAVLAVIITDGMENASEEFNKYTIKKLIEEKEKEGWTFAFLGANIDSYAVGSTMGISMDSTSNYAPGMERQMYQALAQSTMKRASLSRQRGVISAKAAPMFSRQQRASMGDRSQMNPPVPNRGPITSGGRPPAPPSFRPPVNVGKRRQWRSTVSNA